MYAVKSKTRHTAYKRNFHASFMSNNRNTPFLLKIKHPSSKFNRSTLPRVLHSLIRLGEYVSKLMCDERQTATIHIHRSMKSRSYSGVTFHIQYLVFDVIQVLPEVSSVFDRHTPVFPLLNARLVGLCQFCVKDVFRHYSHTTLKAEFIHCLAHAPLSTMSSVCRRQGIPRCWSPPP